MNNLIHRNNSSELSPFGRNNMFQSLDLFNMMDHMLKGHYPFGTMESLPLEVKENEHTYNISVEVPGSKKEDIGISFDKGQLNIVVESNNNREEKNGDKVILSERYYSKKSRSIYLGEHVDGDNIKANYVDGILKLEVPKSQTEKDIKRITVE